MIKVLLADDHKIILDGIAQLLQPEQDIEVVAQCIHGRDVIEQVANLEVDVYLLDLDMPEMNGIDCAQTLLKKYPNDRIIILSMHAEKALMTRCLEVGVKGYLIKTVGQQELAEAIRKVAQGETYFPKDVEEVLTNKSRVNPSLTQSPLVAELSPRELEIIQWVVKGKSNKEISEGLFISPRTVDTHRTNIMRKLEVHNVAALVRFAFENKLVH
ncbi:response regulator transcription factor [bacterium SCSIO 12741]|nr:response regulator transcription factor [bacterium SCSIO 12741]